MADGEWDLLPPGAQRKGGTTTYKSGTADEHEAHEFELGEEGREEHKGGGEE